MNKYYKKYESERLYLSPINLEDNEIIVKWLNDETLARGLGHFHKCITKQTELKWLENVVNNGEHHYAIVNKKNDELLGIYGIEIADACANRYHVGGFIGEINNRGKGYGTESLKLITKYAFEVLNAESLFSMIHAFNEASIKSAQKAGYTIGGKYRNAVYYNGQFYDSHIIDIIKKDYLENKAKKD